MASPSSWTISFVHYWLQGRMTNIWCFLKLKFMQNVCLPAAMTKLSSNAERGYQLNYNTGICQCLVRAKFFKSTLPCASEFIFEDKQQKLLLLLLGIYKTCHIFIPNNSATDPVCTTVSWYIWVIQDTKCVMYILLVNLHNYSFLLVHISVFASVFYFYRKVGLVRELPKKWVQTSQAVRIWK